MNKLSLNNFKISTGDMLCYPASFIPCFKNVFSFILEKFSLVMSITSPIRILPKAKQQSISILIFS